MPSIETILIILVGIPLCVGALAAIFIGRGAEEKIPAFVFGAGWTAGIGFWILVFYVAYHFISLCWSGTCG